MKQVRYIFDNKIIVIVGVNSGIGQSLCKQLIESGAMVYGIDIQKNSEVSEQKNLTYFQANPLIEREMTSVVDEIKTITPNIHGLVNLSGIIDNFKSIEETSLEEWNKTYDISFKSCFNSVKAFTRLIKETQNSAIVNMSSGLAFGGQKNYGAYTTAKNAVISFSRTLATELAPRVRVNTIAPGAVETNFIYKEDGSTRFDKRAYERMVPLGTIARPNEISQVILFLLSDGASHVTGQCIHVNGGAFMN